MVNGCFSSTVSSHVDTSSRVRISVLLTLPDLGVLFGGNGEDFGVKLGDVFVNDLGVFIDILRTVLSQLVEERVRGLKLSGADVRVFG